MKKRLSLLLSIVFLFGFFSLPSCMIESSENLAYTITGDTCTITGIGKNKSRKIVIPSEIEGKPVTTIADEAFKNDDWLYSVSIPASVTYVGEYAFYDCDFLKYVSIDMPSGSKIMPYAFAKCKRLEEAYFSYFYCQISDFPSKLFYDAKQSAVYLKKTYADRLIVPIDNKLIYEPYPERFDTYDDFISFYQQEFKDVKKKIAIFKSPDGWGAFTIYNGAYDRLEEKPLFAPYVDRLILSTGFYTDKEAYLNGDSNAMNIGAKSYFFDEALEIDVNNLTFNFIEDPNGIANRCSYEVYFGTSKIMVCSIFINEGGRPEMEKFEEAIQHIKENMIII